MTMGDSSANPVSPDMVELIERRITERVVERARGQVVKYYVTVATTALAILGAFGWNANEWMKTTAERYIGTSIDKITSQVTANTAQLHSIQSDLTNRSARIDALLEQSEKASARIEQTLVKFTPQSRRLETIIEDIQRAAQDIDEIEAKLRDTRGTDSRIQETSDSVVRISREVKALADQVKQMLAIIQTSHPAGTNNAPMNYSAIQEATQDVISKAAEVVTAQTQVKPTTVYVQFAGSVTQQQIDTLRARLGGGPFSMPPAEKVASAAGLFEVRYFHAADLDAAKRLAAAATEAVRSLRPEDRREVRITPLTNFKSKPREGTLELWYGT